MDQIDLVPPQRKALTVGTTTGLNQQHNTHPQVWRSRFKDPMFIFNSEHSLGWSFLTLIENVLCFFRLSWYPVGGLWYRNGTAQKGGSL